MTNLGFDVDHQFLENLKGFSLVLDQWVTLAMCAQADAVAQAVHLVKMFLPQLVNRAQNRIALDFPNRIGICLEADLEFISLLDTVRNEVTEGELGGA